MNSYGPIKQFWYSWQENVKNSPCEYRYVIPRKYVFIGACIIDRTINIIDGQQTFWWDISGDGVVL